LSILVRCLREGLAPSLDAAGHRQPLCEALAKLGILAAVPDIGRLPRGGAEEEHKEERLHADKSP
jgi:hypothetical protein